MKVLYISAGTGQDYLRDCLFLGLRELLGSDAIDIGKLESLYLGADRSQMYGRGFTLYGELPDIEVDRYDLPGKLQSRYFDLIIYGSIHRCQDFLHEVTSIYPPSRICYIDGEDHPGYLRGLPGHYFKRELHNPQPGVHPIQFAIPASKILKDAPPKSRLMAPCDPIDTKTYIYNDEASYYQQYTDSYYGATMKKAGWDCLRHYEIMSQWAIPYFRCLEACPSLIMAHLPNRELLLIKEYIDYSGSRNQLGAVGVRLYEYLIEPIMDNLRAHLTTIALAKYVLGIAQCK